MEAIILAAGLGERLYPLTEGKPKWLLSLRNCTIADYQLQWLKKNGVTDVFVTMNQKYSLIAETYPYPEGVKVNFVFEKRPIGDEGGLKRALEYIAGDEAYVVNCDIITDFPISLLNESPSCVLVHPRSPWGVFWDDTHFEEKPILTNIWVGSGIHRLPTSIIGELVDEGNLAYNIIPKLLRGKRLKLIKYGGFWMSIETIKDLKEAERCLE